MRKKKVLLVEDAVITSMSLADLLELWGYELCQPAVSAEKALLLIEADKPGLVLIDIKLQGYMNGIDLARKIKQKLDASIIFITGYIDKELKKEAASLQPAAYLIKPLNLEALRSALNLVSGPARLNSRPASWLPKVKLPAASRGASWALLKRAAQALAPYHDDA